MTDILVVEELRETRRRLAEQCSSDVQRYAAMLQELSGTLPGVYVNQPLLPPSSANEPTKPRVGTEPASVSHGRR
jgi:hypothetical protein